MDSEVAVKPEPIWLLEDETVLASMKTELESTPVSDNKSEFMQDIFISNSSSEENTCHSLAVFKKEASEPSSVSEGINNEIKTEIEFEEHNLLEDSPELIVNFKRTANVSAQEHGKSIIISNDQTNQDEKVTDMLGSGEQDSAKGIGQLKFTNSKHTHTNTSEKQFACDVCSKCFTQSAHLTRHMRIHTGDKPFKCEICSKCFTHSSSFTIHMRFHNGIKPAVCNVCHKSFSHSANLTSHMRIHTGDKPFKCKVCSKCFTHSFNLTRHMRTHTGDKPFKCEVCCKCFTDSGNLAKHIMIHSGNKPYKCEVCSKCFTESGHLSRHLRTHK